jgi:septum formation inhibitor MinC
MDDFTKKDKYSSVHSAIKDVVSQNNDLYQKAMEEKYGFKQEEVIEEVEELDEATISFRTDISKVRREAPVKGLKSLENMIDKALNKKFKAKMGNYEVKATQGKGSTIADVTITADKKLSKKDMEAVKDHLSDEAAIRM